LSRASLGGGTDVADVASSRFSLVLTAVLTSACSDGGVPERQQSAVESILETVVERASSLPADQQERPWVLLLENDRPPFGVVQILPIGEYRRIDLTRDCSDLYEQLSIIVLHVPDDMTFQWATNYGLRTADTRLATVSIDKSPLDALALGFDLEIQRVTTQLLGFEVLVDGKQQSPRVQYVQCSDP